jgi:hypothetical protein
MRVSSGASARAGTRDPPPARKHSAFTRRGAMAPDGMAIAIHPTYDAVTRSHEGMNAQTRDVIVSGAALLLLVGLLAGSDHRVRDWFADITAAPVSTQVVRASTEMTSVALTFADAVTAHATLTIFVVAGTILVACMLRT